MLVHVCEGHKFTSGGLPQLLCFLLIETGSLSEPGGCLFGQAGQRAPGMCLSLSICTRVIDVHNHVQTCLLFSQPESRGSELMSSYLRSYAFRSSVWLILLQLCYIHLSISSIYIYIQIDIDMQRDIINTTHTHTPLFVIFCFVGKHMGVVMYVWRTEDNLQNWVLSLNHVPRLNSGCESGQYVP